MADRLRKPSVETRILHDQVNPHIFVPELLWTPEHGQSHRYFGFPADVVSVLDEHAEKWAKFSTNFRDGKLGLLPQAVAEKNAEWNFTGVEGGTGDASFAVVDQANGVARLLTDNADNDNAVIAQRAGSFIWAKGKIAMFEIEVAPQDADDGELFFGLAIEGSTNPIGTLPTDGFFFEKAETATKMDFHARKDTVSTELASIDTAAMADDTFHRYGFRVNGDGSIDVFYDDKAVGNISGDDANIVDNERLAIYFAVQTGAAATRYMDVRSIAMACRL